MSYKKKGIHHRQSHYIDGQSQLSHVCAACCPILSQTLGCGSVMYLSSLFSSDLVNGIAYSSGLGGCTESCFSVLDSEQQGQSDDALKVVLDLIFWPAQPREVEKKF